MQLERHMETLAFWFLTYGVLGLGTIFCGTVLVVVSGFGVAQFFGTPNSQWGAISALVAYGIACFLLEVLITRGWWFKACFEEWTALTQSHTRSNEEIRTSSTQNA